MRKLWKKSYEKKVMRKTKVAIAMSGGIDSSVSALLLKKHGYDVVGFFMKFWSDPSCGIKKENSCCDSESLKKAKEVAKKINIPFHVIDAQKLFKKTVVDHFINGYKNLETPNPCILCNKFVKFGWFLDLAEELGFEKIATGHYAQIKKDKNNVFYLHSGKDEAKDQSYFLYQLSQKQLGKIIFPAGNMNKKEVMEIAKANNLKFENKKESQEICFIQDNNYRHFLKRHLSQKYFKPGDIVNLKNKKIGTHQGLLNYTIGQRRGINQTVIKNENKQPFYVVGFNKKGNKLIAGPDKNIFHKKMALGNLSWISESSRKKALKNPHLKVKIRYRGIPFPCLIKQNLKNKSQAEVIFKKPQRAVTPGQYAVFYSGNEVLGGGKIIS